MKKDYLTMKHAPSSAGKAASGVFGSHRAPRQGTKTPMKSGKGHFAAAAQRIAKMRSGKLQHGVPKHAPLGARPIGGSGFTKKPKFGVAQASEGQTALNPEQQGASDKNMQTGSGNNE